MAETGVQRISPFAAISYARMSISKKQIVGILAVALTVVYSIRRWRSGSPNTDDLEFDTEQPSPTAD